MEGIVAALSCVFASVAAYLAVCLVHEVRARGIGRSKLRAGQVRDAFVSWMELLGHRVAIIRLSNLGPVAMFSERLQGALSERGLVLTRRACTAFAAVSVLVSVAVCALLSQSMLGVPVGLVAVCASGAVVVGRYERGLKDRATAQMPEVLRSLATSLGAGKSLAQAIEYVGRNMAEPLASQFAQASFEIKGGRSVEEAVQSLCVRVDAPGMELLGTALQIAQRTGSPLNDLFDRTARMVSDTVGLKRELQVKTSQVRLSAKVVAGMPVLLACILTLISPDYRAGLGLASGRACLCVAALLDITALWMVRRLMLRSLR